MESDEKVTCPKCDGSGKDEDGKKCYVCRGGGKITRLAWEKHYGNPATMKKESKEKFGVGQEVGFETYVGGKLKGERGKIVKKLFNGKYVIRMKNGKTVERTSEEVYK